MRTQAATPRRQAPPPREIHNISVLRLSHGRLVGLSSHILNHWFSSLMAPRNRRRPKLRMTYEVSICSSSNSHVLASPPYSRITPYLESCLGTVILPPDVPASNEAGVHAPCKAVAVNQSRLD